MSAIWARDSVALADGAGRKGWRPVERMERTESVLVMESMELVRTEIDGNFCLYVVGVCRLPDQIDFSTGQRRVKFWPLCSLDGSTDGREPGAAGPSKRAKQPQARQALGSFRSPRSNRLARVTDHLLT